MYKKYGLYLISFCIKVHGKSDFILITLEQELIYGFFSVLVNLVAIQFKVVTVNTIAP